MSIDANEARFQADIIAQMQAGGWVLGSPYQYDRERALYPQDCLAYVQSTQPKEWAKYVGLYPNNTEQVFLDKLTAQLAKADPQARMRPRAAMAPWECCAMGLMIARPALICANLSQSMI